MTASGSDQAPIVPKGVLAPTENSWLKQQFDVKKNLGEAAEDDDVIYAQKIERLMRGILNKLTVEKFDALSEKLLNCGITKKTHIESLTLMIFEKATRQHHFISMYVDLCVRIDQWCKKSKILDAEKKESFKRILLDQCQTSFEKFEKFLFV